MATFPVHPGASEAYEDAERYDRSLGARTEDLEFFVQLATEAGAVLEYGAGSGRVTLPMARGGARVTAVDLSRAMLRALEGKLVREPAAVRRRVQLELADMRTFRSKRRFPLIVLTSDTFGHLYTRIDVEAFLERAHANLEPGGRLVFDVSMPRVPERSDEPTELVDYDPIAQVRTVERRDEGGETSLLSHRIFFPRELEMLLESNGFERVRLQKGFRKRPSAKKENATALVVSCHAATRAQLGGPAC